MTREQRALRIYNLLRQAHESIKEIYRDDWDEFEEPTWETAVDAVDCTLYLAESFFAKQGSEP